MTLLRRSLLATALVASLGIAHAADNTGVPQGPLPRNVVPTLVSLELKLDPKQANFTGTTRIEAQVAEATDAIWMHGRDLTISQGRSDRRQEAHRADRDAGRCLRRAEDAGRRKDSGRQGDRSKSRTKHRSANCRARIASSPTATTTS